MSRIKNKIGLAALLLATCLATQAYTCSTASVEKWIGIVLQAVETVGPLISPLAGSIATLAGQTLTTEQANAINAKLNQAATDLSAIDAALQGITGTPDQTTLGKLNALESAVTANLNDALLQANGISEPATRTTIVNSVQALIATAQKIQSLIPAPVTAIAPAAPATNSAASTTAAVSTTPATSAAPTQQQAESRQRIPTQSDVKSLTAALTPRKIRANFNAALKPTGNPTVDAAFAKAKPQPLDN